jgi:hypothetical protein
VAKPVFATNDVPTAAQFNSWLVNGNFARMTSTQSVTSSTTLVTATDLVIPVEANAQYVMMARLNYSGSDAYDMKVLFRTPTSATFQGVGQVFIQGASSQQHIQHLPYGGNASEIWGILSGGTNWGVVHGLLITAGTAGNFSVEFAQNVSGAGATVLGTNSHMWLYRVS